MPTRFRGFAESLLKAIDTSRALDEQRRRRAIEDEALKFERQSRELQLRNERLRQSALERQLQPERLYTESEFFGRDMPGIDLGPEERRTAEEWQRLYEFRETPPGPNLGSILVALGANREDLNDIWFDPSLSSGVSAKDLTQQAVMIGNQLGLFQGDDPTITVQTNAGPLEMPLSQAIEAGLIETVEPPPQAFLTAGDIRFETLDDALRAYETNLEIYQDFLRENNLLAPPPELWFTAISRNPSYGSSIASLSGQGLPSEFAALAQWYTEMWRNAGLPIRMPGEAQIPQGWTPEDWHAYQADLVSLAPVVEQLGVALPPLAWAEWRALPEGERPSLDQFAVEYTQGLQRLLRGEEVGPTQISYADLLEYAGLPRDLAPPGSEQTRFRVSNVNELASALQRVRELYDDFAGIAGGAQVAGSAQGVGADALDPLDIIRLATNAYAERYGDLASLRQDTPAFDQFLANEFANMLDVARFLAAGERPPGEEAPRGEGELLPGLEEPQQEGIPFYTRLLNNFRFPPALRRTDEAAHELIATFGSPEAAAAALEQATPQERFEFEKWYQAPFYAILEAVRQGGGR